VQLLVQLLGRNQILPSCPPPVSKITCDQLEVGKSYAYYFGKMNKKTVAIDETALPNHHDDELRHDITFEFGSLSGVLNYDDKLKKYNDDTFGYELGILESKETSSESNKLKFIILYQSANAYKQTVQFNITGTLDKSGKLQITENVHSYVVDVDIDINSSEGKFILLPDLPNPKDRARKKPSGGRSLRNTFRRRRCMSHLRKRKTAARRRSRKRSKMT